MALAYQSAGTNADNTATHTVSYPGSIAAGDLLVLVYAMVSDDYKTSDLTSAGFTEFDTIVSTASSHHERRYFKIAAGTESGTLSVATNSGSSRRYFMILMRWTGVFGPTPLSGFQSTTNAASSTTIVAPDPGTTGSTQAVIATAGARGNATATTTESAGYTEVYDGQAGAGGANTHVVAYATGASPGSCTFTWTAAQVNRMATSFVISEAAPGTLNAFPLNLCFP